MEEWLSIAKRGDSKVFLMKSQSGIVHLVEGRVTTPAIIRGKESGDMIGLDEKGVVIKKLKPNEFVIKSNFDGKILSILGWLFSLNLTYLVV